KFMFSRYLNLTFTFDVNSLKKNLLNNKMVRRHLLNGNSSCYEMTIKNHEFGDKVDFFSSFYFKETPTYILSIFPVYGSIPSVKLNLASVDLQVNIFPRKLIKLVSWLLLRKPIPVFKLFFDGKDVFEVYSSFFNSIEYLSKVPKRVPVSTGASV
ncbi:MAG: hypothetical protein ABIK31_03315, partial [candidate division WOR-3 bacterium]